jgi:hypothetical protein
MGFMGEDLLLYDTWLLSLAFAIRIKVMNDGIAEMRINTMIISFKNFKNPNVINMRIIENSVAMMLSTLNYIGILFKF